MPLWHILANFGVSPETLAHSHNRSKKSNSLAREGFGSVLGEFIDFRGADIVARLADLNVFHETDVAQVLDLFMKQIFDTGGEILVIVGQKDPQHGFFFFVEPDCFDAHGL